MVTMEDVAKAAGVSRKTVYNVINNRGSVSEKVRDRVKKTVKALNYKPSIAAQSLKTGKTNLIGVVLPDLYHPAYVSILHSIESEARKRGYNIIACNYDYKAELEEYYFDMLYKRNVEGIIYQPFILDDKDYDYRTNVNKSIDMGFPIVVIGEDSFDSSYFCVSINTEKAMEDAFKYYFSKGLKKPAFMFTEYYKDLDYKVLRPFKYNQPRVYWYYKLCEKYNIEPQVCIHSNIKGWYTKDVSDFLKKGTFDCIICETDYIAISLYRFFKNIGKKPLPLLGFDNAEYAILFFPSVSSYSLDYSFMAEKSFEILLDQIKGKIKKPQNILIDFVFHPRESTENLSP